MNKNKLLLLFLASYSVVFAQAGQLAIVLMVKNEEAVINKTIEPFVKEGIDSFLIFDTGSTDGTIETISTFFKQHGVKDWHIAQEPFIDFATSRNHALDKAEELFPNVTFFLMPDAEWYMNNVKGLIGFCQQEANDAMACYLVRIVNQDIEFTVSRLMRAKTNARFVGAVHEVIATDRYKKVPSDIFFELGVSRYGIEKSRKRWERDLVLLQTKYDADPVDLRNLFYLGQTYECLGDFKNAYEYYAQRAEKEGALEERYEALYRLGRVAQELSKTDKRYTWQIAQDYYFMAHGLMAHRAEPLVKVAEHYWPDGCSPENTALCYLFAKRAYELPFPIHDLLFVDPRVYHFKRYELLSKSAGHMGNFELGELATRKALAYKEEPYLLRNLAYYLDMKKQSAAQS